MLQKVSKAACCLTLLISAGCSDFSNPVSTRSEPTQSLPVQVPDSTLGLAQTLRQLGLPDATVHADNEVLVIALDNETYEPTLLANVQNGLSAVDALANPGIAIVVGSAFVSDLNGLRPVGLLQAQGRVLSEVIPHGYTRILGVSDRGLGVVHRSDYERGLFNSALQVGPGIIEAGELDISTRDLERPKYFRSFVATCGTRSAIGITLVPLNLYTVGQKLLKIFPQMDISCDEVVNLAGDREAILAIRSPKDNSLIYHGHPNTHKVSLLGFRRKSA